MLSKELKLKIQEAYLDWSQAWGKTLVFAMTLSEEEAEKIVLETITALMTQDYERLRKKDLSKLRQPLTGSYRTLSQIPVSELVDIFRFAESLFKRARSSAHTGMSNEYFFKLPYVVRSVVVLKHKAGFSIGRISQVIGIDSAKVIDLLNYARIGFSQGRPWIEASQSANCSRALAEIKIESLNKMLAKPVIKNGVAVIESASTDFETLYNLYLGGDVDVKSSRILQSHLLICVQCRKSMQGFKNKYQLWKISFPQVILSDEVVADWRRIIKGSFKVLENQRPNIFAGWLDVLKRKATIQFFLLILSTILLFKVTLHAQTKKLEELKNDVELKVADSNLLVRLDKFTIPFSKINSVPTSFRSTNSPKLIFSNGEVYTEYELKTMSIEKAEKITNNSCTMSFYFYALNRAKNLEGQYADIEYTGSFGIQQVQDIPFISPKSEPQVKKIGRKFEVFNTENIQDKRAISGLECTQEVKVDAKKNEMSIEDVQKHLVNEKSKEKSKETIKVFKEVILPSPSTIENSDSNKVKLVR